MLCNIYIKEAVPELQRMGISKSSPTFFVDLPKSVFDKLKGLTVKNKVEVYSVQEDPYLKDLSQKWMNGGVQLPEIRIVEKIVQMPPTIIEKTIEVPVEVIKEVEVVKEVIKEIIREVEVIKEVEKAPAKTTVLKEEAFIEKPEYEDEGILIDTRIAFEDWKAKNKGAITKDATASTEAASAYTSESFEVPEVVLDPLASEDTSPILLRAEIEPEETDEKPKAKRGRKKKVAVEQIAEVIVPLTEEELKQYKETEEL